MISARYAPIADDGVIGNLHTVALIRRNRQLLLLAAVRLPGMFASLLDGVLWLDVLLVGSLLLSASERPDYAAKGQIAE